MRNRRHIDFVLRFDPGLISDPSLIEELSGSDVLSVDGTVTFDDTVPDWYSASVPEEGSLSEYTDDVPVRCSDEFDIGELNVPSPGDDGTSFDNLSGDHFVTGRIEGAHVVYDSGVIEFPRIDFRLDWDVDLGGVRVRFPDGYTYLFPEPNTNFSRTAGRYFDESTDLLAEYAPTPALPPVGEGQLTPEFSHVTHPALAMLQASAERRALALDAAQSWFSLRDTGGVVENCKQFGAEEVRNALETAFTPPTLNDLPWIGDIPNTPVPLQYMVPVAAAVLIGAGTISVPTAAGAAIAAEALSVAWSLEGASERITQIQAAGDGELNCGHLSDIVRGAWVSNLTLDPQPEGGPYDPSDLEPENVVGPALGEVAALARFQHREAVPAVSTRVQYGTIRDAIDNLRNLLEKQRRALVGKNLAGETDPPEKGESLRRIAETEPGDRDVELRDATVEFIDCLDATIQSDREALNRIEEDILNDLRINLPPAIDVDEDVTFVGEIPLDTIDGEEIETYEWEFDPAQTGASVPVVREGQRVTIDFPEPQAYEVTLTATTVNGKTESTTRSFEVTDRTATQIENFEGTLDQYEGDTYMFSRDYERNPSNDFRTPNGAWALAREDTNGVIGAIYDPSVTVERGETLRWLALPSEEGGFFTEPVFGDTALLLRFDADNWIAAGYELYNESDEGRVLVFYLHCMINGIGKVKTRRFGSISGPIEWGRTELTWTQEDRVSIGVWKDDDFLDRATFDVSEFSGFQSAAYGHFNNDPFVESYVDDVRLISRATSSGITLNATSATITRGEQATIDLTGERVNEIRVSKLWTDWSVGASVVDAQFDDSTPGEVTLSWQSDRSAVSPTLTITPPDRYVGGTYVLILTASNSSGATAQTTATLTIE